MKKLFILSVLFCSLSNISKAALAPGVAAAPPPIPGTPAGFLNQRSRFIESFNATYPAVAGGAAALETGASTAIDNWHRTEREFLRTLKENLEYNPEPVPGAGVQRRRLWDRIRIAIYARASMTVVYRQAMDGGGFTNHINTYTFPYVFSSGDFHKDRMIVLNQQAYPFCAYNTMDPAGGPTCRNFIDLIPLADGAGGAFTVTTRASKRAFVNSFQDLYTPIHAVLGAIPGVPVLVPGDFPYPAAGDVPAEANYRTQLAHAEMVAYTHFKNSYQDIIADLGISMADVRTIILNIAVTRDTCKRCYRTLYLRSFQNLDLPAPAGGAAPPPVPLLLTVSAVRDYRNSRPASNIRTLTGEREPAAGGGGHPMGGVLYLYR